MRSPAARLAACAIATTTMIACGPVYSPERVYSLARNLEARPLDVDFDLRRMLVRIDVEDSIVEGIVTDIEAEAVRIGDTWYPLDRMRDPGDAYIRNLLTGVGVLTRFIDAETGELIDRFIDGNRIRRVQVDGQWFETSNILFLDAPRLDVPDLWVGQRVRVTTRNRRVYEGDLVPIASETFSVDGEELAMADLESFMTVSRCFECEGARGFLFMAFLGPLGIIVLIVAAGLFIVLRHKRAR